MAYGDMQATPVEAEASVSEADFYQMGLKYATGQDGEVNYVEAHKWFNLAASRGNRDAASQRQVLAAEMSRTEIAQAQKAAREFIRAMAH